MNIKERIAAGEVITANQYKSDGSSGLKVSDPFIFCHENWIVNEICDGELDGMVWIKKAI